MTEMPHNDWTETPDVAVYDRVGTEVDRLYGTGDYATAYELLETTWPGLPDGELHPRMHDPLLFKTYLLAKLDRAEEALETIRAMHRAGFCCGLDWETFDPLRSLDGYPDVEQENARLLGATKRDAKLEYDVHLPEGYDADRAYPLAFVLHGDGGSKANAQDFWRPEPMLERGYIVVYVQSSQIVFTAHYAWLPDPKVAWKDVRTCYDEVCERHTIDPSTLIVSGFSGGAITTVDLVFGEALPATAFICLCPEFKPEHFTPETVARATARGVRGAFIEGALVWPLDEEQEMVDGMQEAGLPLEILLNEGFGHAAPPDFDAKLRRALEFVLR